MGAGLCKGGRDPSVKPDEEEAEPTIDDHPAIYVAIASAVKSGTLDLSQNEMALGGPPVLNPIPPLSALPKSALAESMRGLRVLKVTKSKLEMLPEEIGRALPLLEVLDLADNRIQLLPPSIGDMKKLQKLILFKNHLEALPEQLAGCSALLELNCFDNRLRQLPIGLTQLQLLEDVRCVALRARCWRLHPLALEAVDSAVCR